VTEYDQGLLGTGLSAAAQRLPFLPTRARLGSDVTRFNPRLRTVRSPYDDREEILAIPALKLDAALIHMYRADVRGNAQYLGPDPYFDELFALPARRCYVSVEKIVDTAALIAEGPVQTLLLSRADVDGSPRRHVGRISRPPPRTTAATNVSRVSTRMPLRTSMPGPGSLIGSSPVTKPATKPKSPSSARRHEQPGGAHPEDSG
jgi:hypothetical protein